MPQPDSLVSASEPSEILYVVLLFALFVFPRMLQRFRVPAAITSLALGVVGGMGLGLFQNDHTIHMLSTFGIVSLFLFAGIDVDTDDLRREARVVSQHLVIRLLLFAVTAAAIVWILHLQARAAALVALAALTPSTGFILDAINTFDVSERERFWIKSKAIATEILALFVLFVTLQLVTLSVLLVSCLTLLAMIMLLPLVFRAFAAFIVPHAPRSEFAFLLMVAVVCAFVTRELGVYYLVGAFVVGMAAQRFRRRLPAMASEEMVHALELFASFFVPFYFFNAGLHLRKEDLGADAFLVGGLLLLIMIPLRVGVVLAHRAIALGENPKRGVRVAASMLPTLVFTLVIAEILRDRFGIAPALFGGLVIYAIGNTLIPGIALRIPTAEITAPHATPLPGSMVDADRAKHSRVD